MNFIINTNYICWSKAYRVYAIVHNGDSFPQCGQVESVIPEISIYSVWYATITYDKWNAVRKPHTFTNQTLAESEHSTLQSDGTTKFGHKYHGYEQLTGHWHWACRCVHCCYIVVNDITCQLNYFIGSSRSCIWSCPETLQEIIEELSQTSELHGQGYSDTGKRILRNINSTMSDRASSQKAFNTLLSAYRAELLPGIAWVEMSSSQCHISTIFFVACTWL